MWKKSTLVLGFVSLALPSAVAAQTSPATGDDQQGTEPDIVVIGNKEKVDVYQEIISSQFIVRSGGKHDGQYARFTGRICPSVTGFSDEISKQIKQRIRDVISIAKVPLGKRKCRENMIVIAVDDGAATIKSLRKSQKRLFSSLTIPDRDKLVNSTDPIYNWKSIQTVSSDSKGNAKEGTISAIADNFGGAPGAASTGAQSYGGQRSHVKSRSKRTTIEGISYSYLLVERSALKDVTVTQLADYVTMLSLIDMDSETGTNPPPPYSILSLFDQDDPALRPTSIGDVDIALLNALYKSPANVKASAQRSAMVHRIKKQLDKSDKKEK